MVPSTHVEVPAEPEVKQDKSSKTPAPKVTSTPPAAKPRRAEDGTFQSSMLEYNHMTSGNRFAHAMISLAVNAALIGAPILAALFFTDTLDLRQLQSVLLVAPPPPPPPPPPAAAPQIVRVKPMAHLMEAGKLVAPRAIPKDIKIIKEDDQPPDASMGGVAGGVPGGVAGGSMGGVLGGVIGGSVTSVPLAPPPPKPKAPVRVGGRVKEPRLISRVDPVYPPLAKQTHMQGTVVIDAVLDEKGDVIEMKVLSGPPLLIQAAVDAVRRWKYQPTYLNDEPVQVQLNVTVTFRLSE
jgi:periplasmic protein TonB